MPAAQLIVVGGGEHARVVAEAALANKAQWKVLGFVDPVARKDTIERGTVQHLGDDAALRERPKARLVLGFGGIEKRKERERAVHRLSGKGREWATVIHPQAIVSAMVTLDPGTVVMAGAIVQTGAKIGEHVVINSGAIIEHDVTVGDFAQISPGAMIGGAARIGRQVFVGLGAVIRDHITIGDEAVIGMGAVVVSDVAPRSVMIGVPAKPTAGD